MDDDATICEMLRFMLRMLGYEVVTTGGGAAAVAAYLAAREAGRPFAAVILDLTVREGMGGEEAVGKLLEIDPGAKVIVSSGYTGDPVTADYASYGFCAVATKPYSIDQMEKTLGEVLSTGGRK